MDKSSYFKLVATWERLYGVPSRAFKYDPSEVKACCEKCGMMSSKMSRHHKGNDFFFALWFPEIHAAIYIQFRKQDCAKLCDSCHASCERFYKKLKQLLYDDFNALGGATWASINPREESIIWIAEWRARFIELYDKWLTRPPRKRKKNRRRKRRLTAKQKD